MGMTEMPQVRTLADGSKIWDHTFEKFYAKVFVPKHEEIKDIINYGFITPYLLVFEEKQFSDEEAVAFADERKLTELAKEFGGSVVFVYPTVEGGWSKADAEVYTSLISNTKMSQYYEDGIAKMRDRFTGNWGETFIRGAILRSCIFGYGESADYVAKYLLQRNEGDGLWFRCDVSPVTCVLENLSVKPNLQKRDIPIVSVGNSEEINQIFKDGVDHLLIKEKADYVNDFKSFFKKFRRMVDVLDIEPDLDALNVVVEPGYTVVPTSKDNAGDYKDTKEHIMGYVAFYQKGIMDNNKKVPLVMCFHGGGDSAFCMSRLSDWQLVVADHEFLLVCVENHMDSTATEAIALMEHIKEKYNVDTEKIYSTGFSMGGCKTWDMVQEYPGIFAAVAPMDATFEVGFNVYGQSVGEINQDVIVPVFYVGGEQTPLPELPFQAQKCIDRMAYMLKLNKAKATYDVKLEEKDNWVNPIFGIDGDVIRQAKDDNRGSVLTMHLFESENGCCYSVFGSASNQQHEMRHLNCENAWKYMSQFRRLSNGQIEGGAMEDISKLW